MSRIPAIRLLTEALRVDDHGVSTGTQFRQVLLDGEGVLRLRRELGNDGFDVLEVLFILAEPQPSGGVVIHGGPQRVGEFLGWSRQKTSRVITDLENRGFVHRSQEAIHDPSGSLRFGRGVIVLNTAAAIDPRRLEPDREPDLTVGLWGKLLSPAVCSRVLSAWGVRDAENLAGRTDVRLLSDAVKFVAYELHTGAAIENPGAYTRAILRRRDVVAPAPHVDPAYLNADLEVADLVGATRAAREDTLERAKASKAARRRQLNTILASMEKSARAELETELDDLMRGFSLEPDDIQAIHYFDLLENALAERGLLASIPEGNIPAPPPVWVPEGEF
jgi:hypothetical protein